MTRQEFFSFYCSIFSMAELERVPNLNQQIKIQSPTTALSVVQRLALSKSACYKSTIIYLDFTADTKNSCFHGIKELTIPHLGHCYLSYKVEVIPEQFKVLTG